MRKLKNPFKHATITNLATIAAIAGFLILSVAPLGNATAATPTITLGTIQQNWNDSGASTAPVVATDSTGQYVYVAWEDATGGKAQTHFTVNNNFGAAGSWSTPVTFTGNSLSRGASTELDAVQIAVTGSYVYLTWEQGGNTAYAANSNHGTGTLSAWTYGIITGAPSGKMTAQAVTAVGTYAYFTWADNTASIFFSQIHDTGGGVFSSPSTPVQLNSGTTTSAHGEDESASVMVGGTYYLYVVWDSIYFTVSSSTTGAQSSFSTPANIKPAACIYPCLSREPMVTATGSNVYVTYPSDVSGSYQTYIVVSNNFGANFVAGTATPQLLSGGLSNTREVQQASSGSNVYVTSRGTKSGVSGTQQYVYVSTDSGATFSSPILVAQTAQSGSESGFGGVKFDTSNGYAYVYWPHGSTSQLFVGECQTSCATSTNWTSQQVSKSSSGIVLLGDPGGSQGPMLAAINGHVYFVWEDTSTGSGDIYFVAGTQS